MPRHIKMQLFTAAGAKQSTGPRNLTSMVFIAAQKFIFKIESIQTCFVRDTEDEVKQLGLNEFDIKLKPTF